LVIGDLLLDICLILYETDFFPNNEYPITNNRRRRRHNRRKPVTGNTLSKQQRIGKASLFREAFAQKSSFPGRFMVLWLRKGEGAALRLGVVTSKKVSNRAVDRNRARRVLRDIYRRHRAEFTGTDDVVIIGRRALLDAPHAEVEAEMLRLAGKAGLTGNSKHETPKPEGNPND
jgi:ribonuclease P protein component